MYTGIRGRILARELRAYFGIVAAALSPNRRPDKLSPPTKTPIRKQSPVPPQTIPAKAGISQPHAANGGVTKAAMPPTAKRFLPTQEWSCGGRGIVGDSAVICIHDTVRFLPSQEWSTWGRECAGVFWHCRRRIVAKSPPRQIVAPTNPKSTNNPPSPHRPFLRRQESHNHLPPTAA